MGDNAFFSFRLYVLIPTVAPVLLIRSVLEVTPWQVLLMLDQKSDDFTHLASQLLNDQRCSKSEVPQLTEEEVLTLIELIESTVGLTISRGA